MKPVSPVPVGQTNEEDCLQWAKAAGQNLFFKVSVFYIYVQLFGFLFLPQCPKAVASIYS